eukprot:TRINITY_DN6144_c0_g1_i1.p1 TRINITY_DN6144_c0_g1~~TRINITY_DN6144_c0_g1_i1.p1  ORF type:complete len:174 (+),score=30.55 TRINITY_DN6144_c0_g1_i1:32-523(+)
MTDRDSTSTTESEEDEFECEEENRRRRMSGVGTSPACSILDECDFECALCYRLFYRPVTTACGHTYCKDCIHTSLSYSPNCPICRRKLPINEKEFELAVNFTLATILEKHFTDQYKQRQTEETKSKGGSLYRKDSTTTAVESPEQEESPSCYNWYWSALLCDL